MVPSYIQPDGRAFLRYGQRSCLLVLIPSVVLASSFARLCLPCCIHRSWFPCRIQRSCLLCRYSTVVPARTISKGRAFLVTNRQSHLPVSQRTVMPFLTLSSGRPFLEYFLQSSLPFAYEKNKAGAKHNTPFLKPDCVGKYDAYDRACLSGIVSPLSYLPCIIGCGGSCTRHSIRTSPAKTTSTSLDHDRPWLRVHSSNAYRHVIQSAVLLP